MAELARAAGTTIRNVRVYQDRGLLAPPRREGRIGLYDEEHLDRLKLIGRLLGRGYTFATIRELFDAWSSGQDLATVVGLRKAGPGPSGRLTADEVGLRFGVPVPAESLKRAVHLGLLTEDETGYQVPSPKLLDAGSELVAAGVPLEAVLDLVEALKAELATMAERLAGVMLADRPAGEAPGERLLRLRPPVKRTVDALLLIALQEETVRRLASLP